MKKDELVVRLLDDYGSWVSDKEKAESRKGRMSDDLYPYDVMFSPVKINKTTVKNRIVMAPMGNINMCEETGRPNDKMLRYFFERAKGGVGLITTGLVPVSHGIDPTVTEKGKLSYFPRIDRTRTVQSGWRDLAQGVHAYGSKIFVQLTAGLGRVGNPQCLVNELKIPRSASFNPNFYMSQIPCIPLSDLKLRKIVKNMGRASADAMAFGIDGVYLHGHEGYLLDQMTNPAFNRRKLGRYADWQRFGIDIVSEIRRRVGDSFPIMYRIDLSCALNETYGEEMESIRSLKRFVNGRGISETLEYMENLVKAGVDIFDVDLGCYDNWWLPHPPANMPAGCFLDVAKQVKEHFAKRSVISNAGVEVPIVGVGKLGYPDLAEKALRDGMCDMIMLGRPLLADPEWPLKAYSGRVSEIRPCIGCHEGCINEFVEGGHPQCAVNPRTSFEHLYPKNPDKAENIKNIAVIGAGPAGITFALEASKRGHKVTVFEKNDSVGGNIVPGSVPDSKFDLDNYRIYLENSIKKASDDRLVDLRLSSTVDAEQMKALSFDCIVTAVGAGCSVPEIKGVDSVDTVTATELLACPERLGSAKNIVVVGGGTTGCEVAHWLSLEHKRNVTVVEMQPYFMDGVCTANRGYLLYYLKKQGVRLMNMTKVTSFGENCVNVAQNKHKNVPDPYNTWQPVLPENVVNPLAPKIESEYESECIPADLVVFSTGMKSVDKLYYELQTLNAAPEIYNIGDSFSCGSVLEATRSAFRLAREV
ncbi:MAG: FAD-dependent oxidoreductase [Clostridia bacterium]|nr:FAD-dependent oxidoreductase [Clostridia bacterium]